MHRWLSGSDKDEDARTERMGSVVRRGGEGRAAGVRLGRDAYARDGAEALQQACLGRAKQIIEQQ